MKLGVLRSSLVILFGVALGALLAFGAWKVLYAGAESVAIIDIGSARYEDSRLRFPRIVDYLESEDFSKKVATLANMPVLASALPSKRFGGGGLMTVRELREDNQIEFRVRLRTPGEVDVALESAVLVLMKELQAAKTLPATQEDAYFLVREFEKAKSIEDNLLNRISENLSQSTADEEINYQSINSMVLLRDSLERDRSKYLDARRSLSELFEVPTRPTVLVSPTPARPLLESPFRMIALGALSGLFTAIFFLLARRNRVLDDANMVVAERDGP
jgi:hypothetical protein